MPDRMLRQLALPAHRPHAAMSRLWREWCFFRTIARHIGLRLLLVIGLMVSGGLLFQYLEPEKHHSLAKATYFTWSLVFGQAPEDFPVSPALQVFFFLMPVLGLLVIIEGLVDCALVVRDRRRNERSWCGVMAASLSNHIILIGLGKLGFRTYRLLRQLGEAVVVIEKNADNQFLDDLRRDGTPLFVGDARREALLNDAHVSKARSIILATNHDLANLEIALDARQINPNIRVVMRMFDQNMADKIRAGFDIQTAMSQSAISAPAFVVAALDGSIVSSFLVDEQLFVLERWPVSRTSPLYGKTIGDVMTDHGVGVVQRRSKGRAAENLPSPATRIADGDELLVQGAFEQLERLRREVVGVAPAATG